MWFDLWHGNEAAPLDREMREGERSMRKGSLGITEGQYFFKYFMHLEIFSSFHLTRECLFSEIARLSFWYHKILRRYCQNGFLFFSYRLFVPRHFDRAPRDSLRQILFYFCAYCDADCLSVSSKLWIQCSGENSDPAIPAWCYNNIYVIILWKEEEKRTAFKKISSTSDMAEQAMGQLL